MQKFLYKLLTYLISGLLLSLVINFILVTYTPEYFLGDQNTYIIFKHQFDKIKSSLPYKNIIIGDSRGNTSIKPTQLGPSWVNFSLPGTDFFEGYLTLKNYLAHNGSIDTVIMIYGRDYIGSTGAFALGVRTLPCKLPTIEEIKNLEDIEQHQKILYRNDEQYQNVNEQVSTIKLHIAWWKRQLQYRLPSLYSGATLEGLTNLLLKDTREQTIKDKLITDLNNFRGHILFGTDDSDNHVIYKFDHPFKPVIINIIYLDSLMSLFHGTNTAMYLYVPPINKATYNYYKNSLYQLTFNSFEKELNSKYPNLKFIHNPEFLPNNCFGDERHVNARGCDSITKQIAKSFNSQ